MPYAVHGRATRVLVDPSAIEHNVRTLSARVAPAKLWAVVKADGYGHGDVLAANAALRAGAVGLAVALVGEGVRLREAGRVPPEVPVLVLSEQPPTELPALARAGLDAAVYTGAQVAGLGEAARAAHRDIRVHVHIDSGMGRVGVRPEEVTALCDAIDAEPGLRPAGVMSHFAVADTPGHPGTLEQHAKFVAAAEVVRGRGGVWADIPAHIANSAAALIVPTARHDVVRCGITIYGLSPSDEVPASTAGLRPALQWVSTVSFVKRVRAGTPLSYGWTYTTAVETTVVTVPVGYADGVPRALAERGGQVLIGGVRHPIVGRVTMDQLMVDVGDAAVVVGDTVVLIGPSGDDAITVAEWAAWNDTIEYEIVCGIGGRVPRIEASADISTRQPVSGAAGEAV